MKLVINKLCLTIKELDMGVLDQHVEELNAIASSVSDANTKLDAVATSLAAVQTSVSRVNSKLDDVAAYIATLKNGATAEEIAALLTKIRNAKTDVVTVADKVSATKTALEATATEAQAVEAEANALDK